LKKVFDQAIASRCDEIYVTVFSKHEGLTKLFDRYGFVEKARKPANNGDAELVLVRNLLWMTGDIIKDYPFVHRKDHRKYLLAIYPQYHTQLFPDSILNNESYDVVKDMAHTNSIHKVYVCKMDVGVLVPGAVIVIYRTKAADDPGTAEYRSVATSVCVVEEMKRVSDFPSLADFLTYCEPHSVFSNKDLTRL
jgi:hypothetical protein